MPITAWRIQYLNTPATTAMPKQDEGVAAQLLGGDAAVEVVHRVAQDLRLGEGDEVGERDAGEAEDEPGPVARQVGEEALPQVSDGTPSSRPVGRGRAGRGGPALPGAGPTRCVGTPRGSRQGVLSPPRNPCARFSFVCLNATPT